MDKIPIALLGTGAAALEFIESIPEEHPQFEIIEIFGNSTAGKGVADVMPSCQSRGLSDSIIKKLPNSLEELKSDARIFCSALGDDDSAKERVKKIEEICASQKPTYSTASVWRYEPDSLILIPEVNYSRTLKIMQQAKSRGWKGFISPGPNCTSVGPLISLASMQLQGINSIYFDSLQSVSGAGEKERQRLLKQRRQMASGSYENEGENIYEGNVRCDIKNEVEKVRKELRNILGLPSEISINGKCNRVPVEYGHVVSVFIETREAQDISRLVKKIEEANSNYIREFGNLFSSPEIFVRITEDEFGPQPLLEAKKYGGMCTHIGQLENLNGKPGIKYSVLSPNLQKGAAKGIVQNMEFMLRDGYLDSYLKREV